MPNEHQMNNRLHISKGGNQLPAAHSCTRRRPCKSSKVTISKSSLFVNFKILLVWTVWISKFGNFKMLLYYENTSNALTSGLFVVLPTPQLSWRPGPGTIFPTPFNLLMEKIDPFWKDLFFSLKYKTIPFFVLIILFTRLDHKFDLMYAKRAFVHWWAGSKIVFSKRLFH